LHSECSNGIEVTCQCRPAMVVSDNGTELTSTAILRWQQERGIDWHYIAPGKPMQNGFVETTLVRAKHTIAFSISDDTSITTGERSSYEITTDSTSSSLKASASATRSTFVENGALYSMSMG